MTPVGPRPAGTLNRRPFQSTRLKREIYKPCIFIGFVIATVIPKLGRICSVLDDDFSNGVINPDIWEHEVRLDGYGSGSFQWTTASSSNSYIQGGILYIVPTLTSDHLGVAAITNGYTLNLTADGTCTSNNVSQCVAVSNSSLLTPQSNTVKWWSGRNSQAVIGIGRGLQCCLSMRHMALGQEVGRLIS
ncbi:hypothetical protein I312_100226 [Cryptococcus bacillisporus CA1280]|uniref:uncharacterized protein n=1 Tax=Cryptococcus bacillisporus CA1280 TaxID=1296109 RepID=UPI003366BB92